MNHLVITEQDELEKFCEQLQDSRWLALDTEFIRERTYDSQLCLIQIADATRLACIDPLTLNSLEPLVILLDKPTILKVFHAANQDLEIFYRLNRQVPQPLFDTQIGAALLGYGDQIGYAALVKQLLHIDLDKSHTRTNWQQRPLKAKQIEYALNDVKYLAELYPLIRAQLEKKDRLDWVIEDSAQLINPALFQTNLAECWQQVKGANKLKRQQLNVLKHLAAWREQRAIDKNRPRRWILKDHILLELATQQPSHHDELTTIPDLEPRIAKEFGGTFLQLIQTALAESNQHWPENKHRAKPTATEAAILKQLNAILQNHAGTANLNANLICSRGDLYRLIRGERNLPLLRGWRLALAGKAILEELEQAQQ